MNIEIEAKSTISLSALAEKIAQLEIHDISDFIMQIASSRGSPESTGAIAVRLQVLRKRQLG